MPKKLLIARIQQKFFEKEFFHHSVPMVTQNSVLTKPPDIFRQLAVIVSLNVRKRFKSFSFFQKVIFRQNSPMNTQRAALKKTPKVFEQKAETISSMSESEQKL